MSHLARRSSLDPVVEDELFDDSIETSKAPSKDLHHRRMELVAVSMEVLRREVGSDGRRGRGSLKGTETRGRVAIIRFPRRCRVSTDRILRDVLYHPDAALRDDGYHILSRATRLGLSSEDRLVLVPLVFAFWDDSGSGQVLAGARARYEG